MPRTLVFCTSYASTNHSWNTRWAQWLSYISTSPLNFDEVWIVDDGSPCVPSWPQIEILDADQAPTPSNRVSIHRFSKRLGQQSEEGPFPGWYRSFAYAVCQGILKGFDRIIHIESDAFLISKRSFDLFNEYAMGWMALWCPTYKWPESTLQVITRSAFPDALGFFSRPYREHRTLGKSIEAYMPFTHIEKGLVGDRYGEISSLVPVEADYVSQVRWEQAPDYYWWLDGNGQYVGEFVMPSSQELVEKYGLATVELAHRGVDYRQFLAFIDQLLQPNSYLEIGTHQGDSAEQFSCQSICIDPNFMMSRNIVGKKPSAFFFQTTSDDFFARYKPTDLVGDIDVSFLDGLHHYEALLRDFLNLEANSHLNTLAILHDCLPLNVRMTSRDHGTGPEDEDAATRGFWTGDVWKIVPILKELRPNLQFYFVDCPPTGLVLCKGLLEKPSIPTDAVEAIVSRFSGVDIRDYGLTRLWSLAPILDSRRIMADPLGFGRYFRLHGAKNRGATICT